VVEGVNNKAKLTTRKAFGFRTFKAAELALFHTLGDLPEPDMTHRFCEEANFLSVESWWRGQDLNLRPLGYEPTQGIYC